MMGRKLIGHLEPLDQPKIAEPAVSTTGVSS
jgi:hypothetical protein